MVAVDEQSEQSLDAYAGAFEVLVLGGVGEFAQRGEAKVLASDEADVALAAGGALRPQRAGLAVGPREPRDSVTELAGAMPAGLVDRCGVAAGAGDEVVLQVNRELFLGKGALV